MNKSIAVVFLFFILFALTNIAFAIGEDNYKKISRYDNYLQIKTTQQKKKAKLKHYHGEYVKYNYSKSCCRIRD